MQISRFETWWENRMRGGGGVTNRIFQFCRLDFSITAPILLSWLEQTDSNLLPTFGKRHRQLGFHDYDDLREREESFSYFLQRSTLPCFCMSANMALHRSRTLIVLTWAKRWRRVKDQSKMTSLPSPPFKFLSDEEQQRLVFVSWEGWSFWTNFFSSKVLM